jgi:hypothetical protein
MDYQHLSAILVADAPGLDFLNSVATPTGEQIDWISDGEGLLAWLEQAGLVPRSTLEALRSQVMPGELDGVAAQARSLREWFRGIVQRTKGTTAGRRGLA